MKLLFAGFALLAASALAVPCRASGFLLYDISGEALGRASAISGDVSDATAVFFNPAALAYLDGASVSAGGVFVTARAHFEQEGTGAQVSSERAHFVLPALFAHAAVSERVTLGMGVYSVFGIGLRWPNDWIGRESTISASLVTLTFNPTVAFAIDRRWSIAAGFDAIRSTVDFQSGLPPIVGGDVQLAGGTWGFGANAALLYRAIPDRLQLALTYRSRVKLEYDGRADFQPANRDFERGLPDQPGSAAITLPDILTAGVAYHPSPDLALTLDVNAVLWSTYDRVDIDFSSAPDRALRPQGQDTFTLRAGADFTLPTPGLHVRCGAIFDRSAIPAEGLGPSLPDSDRVDLAAGFGYRGKSWSADAGYLLVMFLPAEARGGQEGPEGTYSTLAHLFGLTLGVSF
jgi:long-chain fatty acid transport protein